MYNHNSNIDIENNKVAVITGMDVKFYIPDLDTTLFESIYLKVEHRPIDNETLTFVNGSKQSYITRIK
jgi:hypothetical protein